MSISPGPRPFLPRNTNKIVSLFQGRAILVKTTIAICVSVAVIATLGFKYYSSKATTSKTANIPALENKEDPKALQSEVKTTTEPHNLINAIENSGDQKKLQEELEIVKNRINALASQNTAQAAKITELEKRIDKQVMQLAIDANEAINRSNELSQRQNQITNRFDISSLQVVDISPNALSIMDHGKRVSVKPGQALPGGVVFISYDAKKKVLRTSAGSFSVEQ